MHWWRRKNWPTTSVPELAARTALALYAVNRGSQLEALGIAYKTLIYAKAVGLEVPGLLFSQFPLIFSWALAAIRRGVHPAALQERRTAQLFHQGIALSKALDGDELHKTLQALAPSVLAKLVASVDRRLAKSAVDGARFALTYTHRFAAAHALAVGDWQYDCITEMQLHQIHQAFCRFRRADLPLDRPHAGTWIHNKLDQHRKYQGVIEPLSPTFSKVCVAEQHMADVVVESILFAERTGQPTDAFRRHLTP